MKCGSILIFNRVYIVILTPIGPLPALLACFFSFCLPASLFLIIGQATIYRAAGLESLFPPSFPPRHPRLAHSDASISAGLNPSSSSMPLCSKRHPASFALFVTFIADDALRKNLSRPIIFLIILVSLGVVAHQGLYLTLLEAQDAAEVAVLSSYILL